MSSTVLKFFLIIISLVINFVASTSMASAEGVEEAPADSTMWVYKTSHLKDCQDADTDQTDIAAGEDLLAKNSIRVLSAERNLHPSAKARKRNCNDADTYVACFLIFSDSKKAAKDLGFTHGGLCGANYKSRVH